MQPAPEYAMGANCCIPRAGGGAASLGRAAQVVASQTAASRSATSRATPAAGGHPETPEEREAVESARVGADFSLEGRMFYAKVVDVHDGDTCRVVFVLRGELTQFVARMAGYDSPELRPPLAKPNREAEIAAAKAARDALQELATARKAVYIRCGKFDKYGRLLVRMYRTAKAGAGPGAGQHVNGYQTPPNTDCINELMVQMGHGVPYDGGTKTPFGYLDPPAPF